MLTNASPLVTQVHCMGKKVEACPALCRLSGQPFAESFPFEQAKVLSHHMPFLESSLPELLPFK